MPESVTGQPGKILKALRDAARGQRVLVILDDAWDNRHVRALDPLDPKATHSRLLVSTRIRRLLGGGPECADVDVGVLTQEEAVRLLLDAAGLEIPGGDQGEVPQQAREIVDLCGRLPLTVAIAGGIVGNYGTLEDDLVQMIKEDQLRGEAEGVTVEERIIEGSLRSLGAERAEVERVFLSVTVLPEDAAAEAAGPGGALRPGVTFSPRGARPRGEPPRLS